MTTEAKKAYMKLWRAQNKERLAAYQQEYNKANKEHIKEKSLEWRQENKEKYLAKKKEWNESNTEKRAIVKKNWDEKNKETLQAKRKDYRECNKEVLKQRYKDWYEKSKYQRRQYKNAMNAKRRASKIQRTPNWLTSKDFRAIESMYVKAKKLEGKTGIKHHVDHIIPLRGKNVSGLHVPANLQIISATDNVRKGNRYQVDA